MSAKTVAAVDVVSTVVKAFVGYEFVGLAEQNDDCCVVDQRFAGNDQVASVSRYSIVTVVDVVSMVVKAFVGCESDSVLDSLDYCAANVALL